jgi:hypothetical protein
MSYDFESDNSEWVNVPGPVSTFQNVTGATLMAWVNAEALVTTDVISAFNVNGGGATSRLAIEQQAAQFIVIARRLDADAVEAAGGGTPAVGALIHVAGVADYDGQSLILYVNGVNVGSAAPAGWTGATSNTGSDEVAHAAQDDGSADYYDGRLQDVRAYQRNLSAIEIANIVASRGKDGNVLGLVDRWKLTEFSPGTSIAGAGVTKDNGVLKNDGTPVNTPTGANWLVSNRRRRRRAA